MNTSVVDYSGTLDEGREYDLPDERAKLLIKAKQAEPVGGPVERKTKRQKTGVGENE